jgi:hypothetical protein
MKAKDLDKIFDDGEVDMNDYLDLSKAFRLDRNKNASMWISLYE